MNVHKGAIHWLMLAIVILTFSAASFSQVAVGISVRVGPPPLPVYAQPICPGPGYFWTPGYWAWDDDDGYYWVPGTWVVAPVGMLWTPGYWGWGNGLYLWHAGYWGPHIGFYGGINYGFGYTGVGFVGGEWHGREFAYNRSVTNVNVTVIHNVYNRTVIVNNVNRVSFNGGPHGIQVRESERERIAEHEHHFEARREQIEHEHAARGDRSQWASVNHGRPTVAASGRPGEFHRDVVSAHGERAADHRAADRPGNASTPNRNGGRNDRPVNAVSHENNSRPNSAPSNNMRQAKEARPVPNSKGPQGEARGNPHVAPAQHSSPAPHGNTAHESAPHSNSKPEHGKPEKP